MRHDALLPLSSAFQMERTWFGTIIHSLDTTEMVKVFGLRVHMRSMAVQILDI
ncbi:hypothetical protein [Bacillus sp. BA3]|uniref:hypothetical protein n=1 Tax=Bacillus sp. BA3 TaxID=2057910 RepID=UPI0012FE9D91|nr:hypothetical protein [Bacillus sp. BA3]MCT4480507.1 hypothetical protein [Peribacillus frigoritolerans]